MIRRTPEVRDKLLRDFAAGCQSAAEFCRARGINEQTFAYWRKRHAAMDASSSVTSSVLFRQIQPEPALMSKSATLVLDIGSVRIAIDSQFDPVLLRRVVQALS